jgi:PKD repeat protein
MVYDARDREVVLWNSNATWIYSQGEWTQLRTSTSPSPRIDAAFGYDPADGYAVMFGGVYYYPSDNVQSLLGDTWIFTHSTWLRLHPDPSPGPRRAATLTYDPSDGYLMLFGGSFYNDTWSFLDGSWTNRTTTASPSARFAVAMVSDAADRSVLLFGGSSCYPDGGCRTGCGPTYICNDTWTYAGSVWTNITARLSLAPPGRDRAEATYDAQDGWVLLLGGFPSEPGSSTGLWSFSNGTWVNRTTSTQGEPPPPLAGAGFVDDVAGQGVILAGGYLQDQLEFDGHEFSYASGAWSTAGIPISPSPRTGAAMVYDPADHEVVLFGGAQGRSNLNNTNDTWVYLGGVWEQLFPRVAPSARADASMIYDASDGYVLLFGGVTPGFGLSAETWSFLGGHWTNRTVLNGSSPGPRASGGLAYDSKDQYVVVFGGWDPLMDLQGGTYGNDGLPDNLADTWSYHGGVWTNITNHSKTHPTPRVGMRLVDDPSAGYVVAFGGGIEWWWTWGTQIFSYSDTWKFSGGHWTNITQSQYPPGRTFGAMAYDPSCDCVLLYGGSWGDYVPLFNDTWMFANGSWNSVEFRSTAGTRADGGMTWDPADGYLVVYGGSTYGGARGDTWTLQPVGLAAGANATPRSGVAPLTVNFTSNATGGSSPYRIDWEFGVGEGNSPSWNVTHQYHRPGTYLAAANVTDASGEYEREFTRITVAPTLTLNAYASPGPISKNLSVRLVSDETGGEPPFQFHWNFGDGSPGANGSNVTHDYPHAGMFLASESLDDSGNASVSTVVPVEVGALPGSVQIFATPSAGPPPLSVTFGAKISGWPNATEYSWNFGDGASSPAPTPVHLYTSPGVYEVHLQVADGIGDVANTTLSVEAGPAPTLSSSGGPDAGSAPLTVRFNASISGGSPPYVMWWDFGDGNLTYAPSANHTYTASGLYTAQFWAEDSSSVRFSSAGIPIQVTPLGAPDSVQLESSSSVLVLGGSLTLTAAIAGSAPLRSIAWSGLPIGCPSANSSLLFCEPDDTGNFSIEVVITDVGGRGASASTSLEVVGRLEVAITQSTLPATSGRPLFLRASIAGGTPPYRIDWTGLPPMCPLPVNTTADCGAVDKGSFRVSLEVRDARDQSAETWVNFSVASPLQSLPVPLHPAATPPTGASPALLLGIAGFVGAAVALAYWLRPATGRPSDPPP